MNQSVFSYRIPLVCLLLALLCFTLVGCNSGGDNSPDQYLPNGLGGNSAYDSSEMPVLSLAPGVYTDAITVTLSCSNPSYTVRYTTDCSNPTPSSPEYKEPFLMSYSGSEEENSGVKVFNIRAATFDKQGKMIGRIVSGSYIFPKDADRFTTKVISMVTDPTNLYGETGIIDNAQGRGRAWERPVNFQLYGIDGKLDAQQDLGVRINGTGSRVNLQKNFRLFARKEYTAEAGHLNHMLFPGLLSEYNQTQIEEYDSFLVRGGASNLHNSMITNLIAYEMIENTTVDAGNFEPAALFLNGEYYGLMMILEDYSPYYFESHYGVDENKVSTINFGFNDNGNLDWCHDDCTEAEYTEWTSIVQFIAQNNFSDPSLYEQVTKLIDTRNVIEYVVYECYLNNWDWPRNNQRVWRFNGVKGESFSGAEGAGGYDPDAERGFDGRWRFVAKDLDLSMGVTNSEELGYKSDLETNFFDVMRKDRYQNNQMYEMFCALMFNGEFCRDFYLYLCEFMSTRASVEGFLDLINTLSLQVADEMKYHCAQYGDTLEAWDEQLNAMREFAKLRPALVFDDANEYSEGKGHGYVLNVMQIEKFQGGRILFNGGVFEGESKVYALKNEEIEIQFVPDPGYELGTVKVTGGYCSDGLLYLRNDECSLSVTFLPADDTITEEPTPSGLLINEIGHSSLEKVNGYDWIELYNPTDADISLKNFSITNGIESYTFPDILVPAGSFKIIFCSGTNDGGVYASFTVSSGDFVQLYDDQGEMLDSIRLLTASSTTHLGRYPDGGEWVELSRYSITPNEKNEHCTEFAHHFSEQVRNTVMINGVILPPSCLTLSEDGQLTVTKNQIRAFPALSEERIDDLLTVLSGYRDSEAINLADWAEENKDKKSFSVYYVEALNSYVIHIL